MLRNVIVEIRPRQAIIVVLLDGQETNPDELGLNPLAKKRRVEPQDLLSAEDAQVHLGVGRGTFFSLIGRHKLPKYRIPARGRRVFYKRSDLDRLLQPVRVDQKRASTV